MSAHQKHNTPPTHVRRIRNAYHGRTHRSAPTETKLTAQQRQAISLVLLYGAPNYTNSADKDTEFGYEGATKKKLNPKIEGYIHAGGMVVLLVLMAVILFKDVIQIII